jgi:TonB family protein
MNILIYIIKIIFISGGLLGYYWLFLRNRSFHAFNRYFLLAIPVFSLLIPVLHFDLPDFWNRNTGGSFLPLLGAGSGTLEAITIYGYQPAGHGLTWEILVGTGCLLISSILFIRLLISIRYIRHLRKVNPSLPLADATLYFIAENDAPFSFFRSIFWRREMELNDQSGKQILRHELYHVKQFHSLDMLLLEVISIPFWFNPFFHLIRQELKAIHEYSADAYAVGETEPFGYASLLLLQVSGKALPLTHPFFKNQIKRRIAMITKNTKYKEGPFGRFLFLPLIFMMICLFSFKIQNRFLASSAKTFRIGAAAGNGSREKTVMPVKSEMRKEQGPRADQEQKLNGNRNLNDSAGPYKKVEVEAEFPGGQDAWVQYLIKNIHYPQAAAKNGIQGDVIVEFIVNTNGHLSDIHAISGPDSLRAESVRVIKESGKWIPAMDQGKKVASYRSQPINYRLEKK